MKRITCAFLSMLLITPCMANIHINPDAVTELVAKHFPKKQVECIREYNAQLKASNGAGIAASKLWNVCAAGGLDVKQPADKEKCKTFVNELTSKGTVKFYAACGKDKSVSGAVCINDFTALTVNMQQAQGLAKLYARNKSDNTIQCRSKPRIESTTTTSVNPHAMGMSSTSNTPYLQCTSYNSNKFYEFRFNSVDGNIDATNHKNFKTGICKIFGSKLIQKDLYGYKWDICSDIKDETACNKIDNVVSAGNIGYIASWGPAGYKLGDRGYQITSTSLPYCILTESVTNGNDGTLLFERTAFGLDGRVFLNAGIQRKGSNEIKKQIRTYVENTMGKENVKSFSCEDTYHTIKLKDRSGKDDMLRCTVNDKTIEFFFDDLSEAWGVYDKSGREAMNCIAWGGTFTGKKCIGLDEKMCNTVRDANAQSCPECKLIKWNPNTKTCDLPSSANATSLKRGLTYSAIVGGAVVSVVITVGSLGTATAPTALVLTGLAVETMGSVIELKAQHAIYSKTDEFFEKANKCHNQTCAEKIIKEYLQALSNQQNDMQESEISAADKIFADLFDKIPANSKFYKDIIEQGMQGKTIASNKRGFFDSKSWNPEQIWRAVGVALQIIPTITSVGWRIAKKSDKLVNSTAKLRSKLDDASKYIDDALGIKKTANIDVISKQVDDLISQRNALYKQQSELLERYRFADVSSEEELTRFLAQHPDIEAINKSLDDVSQQIQNIRYANPELWKAGEVVQDANGVVMRADDAARAAAYEEKLTAAYKKYAPKNQTFDDFKKMFANEAEFDKQIEAWSSFDPGMVKNGEWSQMYVSSPYSTYDPTLSKQLKAVDAEYADDIAEVEKEIKEAKEQFRVFKDAKERDLYAESDAAKKFGTVLRQRDDQYAQAIAQLDDEMKELTGSARAAKEAELQELENARQAFRREQESYMHDVDINIAPDWAKDNPLEPLLDDYKDRRWTPRESDYTPEQWSYYVNQKEKENLKQGYEVARDYEKSKLINATISDDVADAVAETRRQELIDIIADDDELFAQAQRFSDLSVTEKQAFLQKAHDKLDDATHVKGFKVRVYEDPKSGIVANAARQYNNKPLGKDLDINDILETIVHEQSHMIDEDAADLGMLGAQKAKDHITMPDPGARWEIRYDWTTGATTEERVKSIESYEVYRAKPTEVSSWKVGGSGKENMMQKIIERRAGK